MRGLHDVVRQSHDGAAAALGYDEQVFVLERALAVEQMPVRVLILPGCFVLGHHFLLTFLTGILVLQRLHFT